MSFKEGCVNCDWNYETGWIEALRAALVIVASLPDNDTVWNHESSILKALSAKIKDQEQILELLKEGEE